MPNTNPLQRGLKWGMNTRPSRAFSEAYAAAIASAAKADKPYTVYFNSHEDRFEPAELDERTSPTDVALYISEDWRERIERLNLQAPIDPKSPTFLWEQLIVRITDKIEADSENRVIELLVRGELEF